VLSKEGWLSATPFFVMKTCIKCSEEKSPCEFHQDKVRPSGLHPVCKKCRKAIRRIRYERNKVKILAQNKTYKAVNKDAIKQKDIEYRVDNRKEISRKQLDRIRNHPPTRIAHNLRSRMYQAVTRGFKTGSAVRDLGCSIPEFMLHVESQFTDNMSWDNYGQWHLDHIEPLAGFDLTDRQQFLKAAHYTNYQPLWAKDNLMKGCS
jgi:hypothetical protein